MFFQRFGLFHFQEREINEIQNQRKTFLVQKQFSELSPCFANLKLNSFFKIQVIEVFSDLVKKHGQRNFMIYVLSVYLVLVCPCIFFVMLSIFYSNDSPQERFLRNPRKKQTNKINEIMFDDLKKNNAYKLYAPGFPAYPPEHVVLLALP
jgi:hypothetical protein